VHLATTIVTPLPPQSLRAVSGFLGRRFAVNRDARLKDPRLSEQFIRLHERRDHTEWFWLGEQVGTWLSAAAHTASTSGRSSPLILVQEGDHQWR
jgi:hypothetical protein